MVFSSLEFLFLYFAVTIVIYFAVPLAYRNIVLLVVSLAFYGWGEPVYVLIMVYSICVDYVCGYFAGKYRESDKKKARRFVIASAILNLAVLGFFKYYTFIVTNLQLLPIDALKSIPLLADVKLPIGISFYTFQTMSYTIDIYRGDAKIQRNIASFGAYVTLFPQLIAGPIVRYQDVDDQLRSRPHSIDLFASGMRTFICGFGKKILLANCAGELWDHFRTLGGTDNASVIGSWAGIIFYMFQIYFDFSGYSDMAIGLGKMLGFRFKENFFYPYISKSITEFWRRWHISMGTWFREYVYIPLGGNRCSKGKMYRNIIVVWLLTGLWHGASWNYVLWGAYYCVLLLIEKAFLGKLLKKAPAAISHVYTLVLVLFGWWLFVFEDFSAGLVYLGDMFGAGGIQFASPGDTLDLVRSLLFFVILCIASTPLPKKLFYKLYDKGRAARYAISAGAFSLLVVCTGYLVDSSYNPFLYFRF